MENTVTVNTDGEIQNAIKDITKEKVTLKLFGHRKSYRQYGIINKKSGKPKFIREESNVYTQVIEIPQGHKGCNKCCGRYHKGFSVTKQKFILCKCITK